MNEARYRDRLNFLGKPENSLEQDWTDLQVRVQTLIDRVKPFYRKDIFDELIKLSIVLTRNKPNKKVYNSILRRIQKVEDIVKDLGGRIR